MIKTRIIKGFIRRHWFEISDWVIVSIGGMAMITFVIVYALILCWFAGV